MISFSIFPLSNSFQMSLLLLEVFRDSGDLSKKEGLGHAMFHAHRGQSPLCPVDAEVAKLDNSLLRIELRGSNRAGFDTQLAPRAGLRINGDCSERSPGNGFDRTSLHALRIRTVHASNQMKIEL
jgi:hypothetical protein